MRKAFTLIEMLIVLGMIIVLAALLLPALSRAREEARSVQCLSNLRQLGQAAFAYAQQNDGYFPISTYGFVGPLAGLDWDLDARTNPPGPGILALGTGGLRILQCPTFQRMSRFDPKYCGYNYNTSYIGGGIGEITPLGHPHQTPARLNAIHRAPRIALFGDGQRFDASNKFMRAPLLMAGTDIGDGWTDAVRVAGMQGYRHLGRTNVCYCDGHAESVSRRFIAPGTQVGQTITYSTTDFKVDGTGFLSADNSAYDGSH